MILAGINIKVHGQMINLMVRGNIPGQMGEYMMENFKIN